MVLAFYLSHVCSDTNLQSEWTWLGYLQIHNIKKSCDGIRFLNLAILTRFNRWSHQGLIFSVTIPFLCTYWKCLFTLWNWKNCLKSISKIQFWAKKNSIQNEIKNLENFHKILRESKHSHSEVGLIHVISLEGVRRPTRGRHKPNAY